MPSPSELMREFETGATKSSDVGKVDLEGFLSPMALRSYGEYMLKHQKQADGEMRESDNWQHGIPMDVLMKSMFRHFHDVWSMHRDGFDYDEIMEDALCALFFNVQAMLHFSVTYVPQYEEVHEGWPEPQSPPKPSGMSDEQYDRMKDDWLFQWAQEIKVKAAEKMVNPPRVDNGDGTTSPLPAIDPSDKASDKSS